MQLYKVGSVLVGVLLACFLGREGVAGTDVPRFESYRVEGVFTGINNILDDAERIEGKWMLYRASAISGKVNFAGHYIVFTGDCGAGAVCGEILDAKTGKVAASFPNAYFLERSGDYFDVVFRPWSRLLIVLGVAADPEKDKKVRYCQLEIGFVTSK